jgi:hypothetical protein
MLRARRGRGHHRVCVRGVAQWRMCHRRCGGHPAVSFMGGAQVEKGGCAGQYLIGGEGVGRQGDDEVAERAYLGGNGVAVVVGGDGEGSL